MMIRPAMNPSLILGLCLLLVGCLLQPLPVLGQQQEAGNVQQQQAQHAQQQAQREKQEARYYQEKVEQARQQARNQQLKERQQQLEERQQELLAEKKQLLEQRKQQEQQAQQAQRAKMTKAEAVEKAKPEAAAKNRMAQDKAKAKAAAEKANKPMGVIELTDSNFDASIRDGSAWLIEFYAPWCGHCNRFAPTYQKVAETIHKTHSQLGDDDRKVMVAKVNGSAHRALASRFSIKGYPTFFLVDGWNVYEYEDERTLEDLVAFATEDYVEYEPIPFLNSPFGPVGQLRASFILVGTKVIGTFEWMTKEKGFSEVVAAMILFTGAITVGIFLILSIGLLTVAKPKQD